MKIIAQVKLLPTTEQADALRRTLEAANAACNTISAAAWNTQTFKQFAVHRLTYQHVKAAYNLSAQLTVRCIAKVADAYKRDRKVKRTFRPHGSIAYDDRILSWNLNGASINIWTLDGRQHIPFIAGERQAQLLATRRGETDLVERDGQWYLLAVCVVDKPTPDEVDGVLGVDLGIVNLATDSDGETYSGAVVEQRRQWYQRRRQALQSVGTRSAKRRLRKLSGRQRRFQSNTNHTIAKRLVAKAKDTKRALALEDLKGIRTRTTVRKSQRARHSNWSFGQLRTYIHYKAARAGVLVGVIAAHYTSQACNVCGCVDKRNRPAQAVFKCVSCAHIAPADLNASYNIRDRAIVNWPLVSGLRVQMQATAR